MFGLFWEPGMADASVQQKLGEFHILFGDNDFNEPWVTDFFLIILVFVKETKHKLLLNRQLCSVLLQKMEKLSKRDKALALDVDGIEG